MFYPQLVAGPIERPQNVLHQFYVKQEFSYDNVANGLRQMAWGMFKKVVIADRIAQVVDPIFTNPSHYSSLALCLGLFLYAFQIYGDFSGYSDIALGTARVMGYHLMTNFNHPFRSKSVTEFWRRWHISLSTWFNDYLFTPIITSVRSWGNFAIVFGLMCTFLISGLWHGAAWNFVIWGFLHGIYVSYEFLTKKKRKKFFNKMPLFLNKKLSVLFTFMAVEFAWIFFRATSVKDGFYIAGKIPHIVPDLLKSATNIHFLTRNLLAGINLYSISGCFAWILVMEGIHKYQGDRKIYELVGAKAKTVRWAIYILCFLAITYLGVFDSKQFIYFQF
jgi:D-alanyl-lipoteichoic acid acyltransferase DltB (MBOAT superfamily)